VCIAPGADKWPLEAVFHTLLGAAGDRLNTSCQSPVGRTNLHLDREVVFRAITATSVDRLSWPLDVLISGDLPQQTVEIGSRQADFKEA
jgi:hypothetical protein